MGTKSLAGFTIIEVMLFLAVTGLLAAVILAGSGVTIGQQRYRDSVNSLKSYIQQQYNEVTNVINDRSNNWTCNAAAVVTEVNGVGQPRGASDCVLLGRLVTVNESGERLTTSEVTGYRMPGAATASNDIAELVNNYNLGVSPVDQQETEMRWGTQIVRPKTSNPMPLSILIVRSPLSGSILTFTADGVQSNPKGMIAVANMSQPRNMCVNADIGTFVGDRLAVRIDAYAASQSAVQIPAESEDVCD